MNKYKLCDNISFVIDNCVILLDFNTGDFFVLSEEYIPIFIQMDSNNVFAEISENKGLIDSLLENGFIVEI